MTDHVLTSMEAVSVGDIVEVKVLSVDMASETDCSDYEAVTEREENNGNWNCRKK